MRHEMRDLIFRDDIRFVIHAILEKDPRETDMKSGKSDFILSRSMSAMRASLLHRLPGDCDTCRDACDLLRESLDTRII